MQRSRFSVIAAATTMLWFTAASAFAQDYPSRPIKVVVPYGAGTGVDVAARLMAIPLSKELGQTIVVENRPGASGAIAVTLVAAAPADGYTLLAHVSSLDSVPAFTKNAPYTIKDLVGVSIYADLSLVLVTSPARGIKSVSELIAAAKARPSELTYASAGVGTATYISTEKLIIDSKIKILHIPYKSTTDAMSDVISGRVDFLYTQIASALGHIKSGKLVALAVSSRRSSALPDVPTIAEAGVPNGYYSLWAGYFAPAKTPKDVVQRLAKAMEKVRDSADFRKQLAQMGGEVVVTTPDEVDAILQREAIENVQLVKALGIEQE